MADWCERLPELPCSDPMLLCCVCEHLLEEPQLLRCLHSCCRSCSRPSSAACAEDDQQATAATAASPTCPICQEVSSDVTYNSLLGSRVSRHIAIAKSNLCGMCADRGYAHQEAEAWCTLCCMSFCETCLSYHRSFHKAHRTSRIDDVKSWDETFPTPSPLCSIHQKPFEFVCFSCKTCCCGDCWPLCSELQHDVKRTNDPEVASYAEKAREDVASFAQMILSKSEVLSKRKQLAAALKSVFQKDLKTLKDAKQQLFTVIDDVCSSIEQRLSDAYDNVLATVAAISSSAETIEHKVDHAAKYSRYVIEAGLTSDLLMQEQRLLSRMKSLCSELEQLEQRLEAGQWVAFDSPAPPDTAQLTDLVTSWIGSPKTVTGILDVHRPRLDSWRKTDLNIGVIGASGVGKSSLINTLRRLRVDDPGAALADVMQTTLVPTPYAHPQNSKMKLWDLPGVGTPKFPRGSYLQRIDFQRYNFFLIICCLRFTEDDMCFARAVQQANKRFYFVRTKVDDDVRHDREDHPATHSEVEVLGRIRDYCVTELSKAGITDPLVYLVCKNPQLFDFPALEEKLIAILLDSKPIGV